MKGLIYWVIVLTVMVGNVSSAEAFCAYNCNGLCPDGTWGSCCATGPCNIFCCNCDGKPREGHAIDNCIPKPPRLAAERFADYDSNGDGAISKEEVKKQLTLNLSDDTLNKEFANVDKNNNGKIEPGEFDSSLGNQ